MSFYDNTRNLRRVPRGDLVIIPTVVSTYVTPSSASFPTTQPGTTSTYFWTVPDGVTSISIVAVGGGGAGGAPSYITPSGYVQNGGGGGGGALAYRNNVSVTPGDVLVIGVGLGGATLLGYIGGSSSGYWPADYNLLAGYPSGYNAWSNNGGDTYVITSSTNAVNPGTALIIAGGGRAGQPGNFQNVSNVQNTNLYPSYIPSQWWPGAGGQIILGEGGGFGGLGGSGNYPHIGFNTIYSGGGGAGGYDNAGGNGSGGTNSSSSNATSAVAGGGGGAGGGNSGENRGGGVGIYGGKGNDGISSNKNGSAVFPDSIIATPIPGGLSSAFVTFYSGIDAGAVAVVSQVAQDDTFYTISTPFTINFLGTSYTTVYASSNGYLTFGTGSAAYASLSYSNPTYPKIMMGAGDRSSYTLNRATTGSVGSRTFQVWMQGGQATSGSAQNFGWSVKFYEAGQFSTAGAPKYDISLIAGQVGGLYGICSATALELAFPSTSSGVTFRVSETASGQYTYSTGPSPEFVAGNGGGGTIINSSLVQLGNYAAGVNGGVRIVWPGTTRQFPDQDVGYTNSELYKQGVQVYLDANNGLKNISGSLAVAGYPPVGTIGTYDFSSNIATGSVGQLVISNKTTGYVQDPNAWSAKFNGTNNYITIPYNSAFNIGASVPFNFECWVFTSSTNPFVIANRNWSYGGSGPTWGFHLINGVTPRMEIAGTGSAQYVMGQSTISGTLNQWNHYAWSRDTLGAFRIFVNGAVGYTRTDTQALTLTSGNIFIGASTNLSSGYANGYISNIRFVVGSVVYTGAFTPSTVPLTAITNTVLLTLQDSTAKDNSSYKHTRTTLGSSLYFYDAISPFISLATDLISGGKVGGEFIFEDKDFEITAWIYPTGFPAGIMSNYAKSFSFWVDGGGRLQFSWQDGSVATNTTLIQVGQLATAPLSLYTWYKVSVKRQSNQVTLYTNDVGELGVTSPNTTINLDATYLSIADSTGFNFGTNNFTIETWINFSTVNNCGIVGQTDGSGFTNKWQFYYTGGTIVFRGHYPSSTPITYCTFNWTPVSSTWYHIALIKSGTAWSFWVNGSSITVNAGSDGTTSISDPVTNLYINWFANDSPVTGSGTQNIKIYNFRIVKGVAVYTGTFTPPTTIAATQSAGTNIAAISAGQCSLLLNSTNFVDTSGNNLSITPTGSASITSGVAVPAVPYINYYYYGNSNPQLLVGATYSNPTVSGIPINQFNGYMESVTVIKDSVTVLSLTADNKRNYLTDGSVYNHTVEVSGANVKVNYYEDPIDNPDNQYLLNNTIWKDLSNKGNYATFTIPDNLTYRAGFGGGLYFNGTSNSYATLPYTVLNNYSSGTIVVWVGPTKGIISGPIISRSDNTSDVYSAFSIGGYFPESTNPAWTSGTVGKLYFRPKYGAGAGGAGTVSPASTRVISTDSYSQVVVSWNSTGTTFVNNIKFYINGTLDSSLSTSAGLSSTALQTMIPAFDTVLPITASPKIGSVTRSGTITNFAGSLHQLQIYNRQLENVEVLSLFESSVERFGLAYTLPVNTVLPSISGSLLAGSPLTANVGTWTGTPDVTSYTYNWFRTPPAKNPTSNSIYLSRSGITYQMPATKQLSFGANGVLELWVYPISGSTTYPASLFSTDNINTNLFLRILPNRQINFGSKSTLGAGIDTTSDSTISENAWSHIAVQVTAGTVAIYINGSRSTLQGTTNNYTIYDFSTVAIGYNRNYNNEYFNGYISNVRLTSTAFISNATFTVSTAPLTTTTAGHTGVGVTSSISGYVQLLVANGTTFALTPSGPNLNGILTVQSTYTGSVTIESNVVQPFGGLVAQAEVGIGGATASTYTPVADDVDSTIRCQITANNAAGSATTMSSVTSLIKQIPTRTLDGSITGRLAYPSVLEAREGKWTGNVPINFSFQWRRNGTNISGATSYFYSTVPADVDTTLSCRITASNSVGTAELYYITATGLTTAVPVLVSSPTISGRLEANRTLTCSVGTWAGSAPIVYSYFWERVVAGVPTTVGTDASTYTLVAADIGNNIRCTVTASNSYGSASVSTTNASAGILGPFSSQTFSSNTAWTVPAGVTSVSIIAVGAGGGGSGGVSGFRQAGDSATVYWWPKPGGGGGVATVDSIAVTPGEVLYVEVSYGGGGGSTTPFDGSANYSTLTAGSAGGSSGVRRDTTYLCRATGGGGGTTTAASSSGTPNGHGIGGSPTVFSGGNYGRTQSGNFGLGGAGAGGYTGDTNDGYGSGWGGMGSYKYAATAQGGGLQYQTGGGGGVGLYGELAAGTNGSFDNILYGTGGSVYVESGRVASDYNGDVGPLQNGIPSPVIPSRGGNGGLYGGGGGAGGAATSNINGASIASYIAWPGGTGAKGGVRIVWGDLRAWPYTLMGNISTPNAPTNLIATKTGATTASVAFTAPVQAAGDPTITQYTAVSSPEGKTSSIYQAGSGTITYTNLSGNTTYTFTVYATAGALVGALSNPSNNITTDYNQIVPEPPIITAAYPTPYGGNAAIVTFTPGIFNGAPPTTNYTVISTPENISATNSWVAWSTYFPSYGYYLRVTHSIYQILFDRNFTIELWFNCTQYNTKATLFSKWVSPGWAFAIYLTSGGPRVEINNTSISITPTDRTMYTDRWYHVALVRNSTTLTLYLDGISIGTANIGTTSITASTADMSIGQNIDGGGSSWAFIGYMSNIRMLNGTALYTSNFTPTNKPLTVITHARFLALQDAAYIDRTNNATIYPGTIEKSPSFSTNVPFVGTATGFVGSVGSLLIGGLTPNTAYTFAMLASNSVGTSNGSNVSTSITTSNIPYAEAIFAGSVIISGGTSQTTYSWTCPPGITSISVLCVGAGGSSQFQHGAGGGGLAYKNNMSVTPGTTYTVTVGNSLPFTSGGNSSFSNGSITVGATGGGYYNNAVGAIGGGPQGNYDGGGTGGTGGNGVSGEGGGGGAGGYGGNGGTGGNSVSASSYTNGTAGAGGGGGGGAGYPSNSGWTSRTRASAGGGVGLFGAGTNGLAGTGNGGSGGDTASFTPGNIGTSAIGNQGGKYGGGAGGNWFGTSVGQTMGGAGGVRIIWPGDVRTFPSTNVGLS